MTPNRESTSVAGPPGTPPPRPRYRRLRRIAGAVLVVAAIVAAAGTALRLYFDDARLGRLAREYLAARTGADVGIEGLTASLLTGVEIEGLRIGNLPGYTRDTLSVARLALRWRLWEALRLRLVVDEVAVEELRLTLERNEHGDNLRALAASFSEKGEPSVSPPGPAPVLTATPARPVEQTPATEPSLPIRVEVHRLALVNLAVSAVGPGLEASVDRVNVEGRFAGHGRWLDLDLWAGLGERAPDGASSHASAALADPRRALDAVIRLGLHLRATGFDDARLTVDLDGRAHAALPRPLPAVQAFGRVEAALDLVAANVRIDRCTWRIGKKTALELSGTAADLLSPSPTVRLQGATVDVELDELADLVGAALPNTVVGGRLRATVAPLAAELAQVSGWRLPPAALSIAFDRVRLAVPGTAVSGLRGTLGVETRGDEARVLADLAIQQLTSASQTLRRLGLRLDAASPLSPFVGGAPAGAVVGRLTLTLGDAGGPAGLARGLRLGADFEVPAALALGRPHPSPLTARLALDVQDVETASAGASGVHATLAARSWDLVGGRLEADARLRSRQAWVVSGGERARLPELEARLDVRRAGEDLDLRHLSLDAAGVMTVAGRGFIAGAQSPRPKLQGVRVAVELPALEGVLALVPESMRPPVELRGGVVVTAEIDGVVDHGELASLARPPAVSLAAGGQSWAEVVQEYAAFITRWADRFDAGLPFVAALRLSARDVAYRDAVNEVSGVDVTAELAMGAHGPRVRMRTAVAELHRPAAGRGLHATVELDAGGAAIAAQVTGGATTLAQAPLHAPLTELNFELGAHYRLGGDLVLDLLRLFEAGHGVRLEGSGVVAKPLALVVERGWERTGMPGLDTKLRFSLAFGRDGDPVPVTEDGPALGGTVALDGALRVDGGLATLAGKVSATKLTYASAGMVIEEVSGALPFDVQLVAGRRDDAVVVARDVKVGGGVLSLVTSAGDVRERRARPAYFDRLQPYRGDAGLTARVVRFAPYEILDLRLDGRIEGGMLLADGVGMHVLGGDLLGNVAVQLARDASVRGDLEFKVSGLDASYFKPLNLRPGPDSELNADFRLGILLAPRGRDLAMNMNITRIGPATFDRLLQLLDPKGEDEKIQKTRANLGWVDIDRIAVWVRYENLNMDLAYTTKLRIPFTKIGYEPIGRETVRRNGLSGHLDTYLQPYVDAYLATSLGWSHVR